MTAVGTVGAAGAAVYFGGVRDRLRRPSLTLHHDSDNPFDRQLADSGVIAAAGHAIGTVETAWLRLRIRNKAGRLAAEDVEVHLSDIRELEPRPGRPLASPRSPGGLPLIWSNTDGVTSGLVPPGADEPIDFASMERTAPGSPGSALCLAVNPRPVDRRHVLTSLRVHVGLTVTSRNADPVHYHLIAFCNGEGVTPRGITSRSSRSPVGRASQRAKIARRPFTLPRADAGTKQRREAHVRRSESAPPRP
jgi:hypothetical protein